MELMELGTLRLIILVFVVGRKSIEIIVLNNRYVLNNDKVGLVVILWIGQCLKWIGCVPRIGGLGCSFGWLLLHRLHLLGDEIGHILVRGGRNCGRLQSGILFFSRHLRLLHFRLRLFFSQTACLKFGLAGASAFAFGSFGRHICCLNSVLRSYAFAARLGACLQIKNLVNQSFVVSTFLRFGAEGGQNLM